MALLSRCDLQDYLPAILDQLGCYGDPTAADPDVVGLRIALGCTLRVLQVTSVGGLKNRHALIDVVAGVANIHRLPDVAAVGFIRDLLAYILLIAAVVIITVVVVVNVIAVVVVAVTVVIIVVVAMVVFVVVTMVVLIIIAGVALVVVAMVVFVVIRLLRGVVFFVIDLLFRVCAIGFLGLCGLIGAFSIAGERC